MSYQLTIKSQVTIPKAIREHLGVVPGGEIDYEPLPDGSVRVVACKPNARNEEFARVLAKWRGTGTSGMTTDEIMRETRGDDWNR